MKKAGLSLLIGFLLLLNTKADARVIRIGLFSSITVQSYLFTPVSSCYLLKIDSAFADSIRPGEIVYLSLFGDHLSVRSMKKEIGSGTEIELEACDTNSVFNLRPAFPATEGRLYDQNLILRADYNRILAINEVNFELYIAGVIESEGGIKAPVEYYKAQAVLCRTYALQNLNKHSGEGFNLCDAVHCQAYFSRSDHNDEIYQSVLFTRGEVALYEDTMLITAAFHSNCGGETQNSEDEWVTAQPYLRSVKDPWCRESRNAHWQKAIPLAEWRRYVANCGVSGADELPAGSFKFVQHSRKEYYLVNGDSIPVKKIRADWMLKSGFFSVTFIPPDQVVIDGRGYGHGIGLCQEGAMSMAKKGFDYREILEFYYTGINIRNTLDELPQMQANH
jgi:stage II sporulation protein D